MTNLGLTNLASSAYANLAARAVELKSLPVASGATPTIGQVLKYNTTNHNWEDFAAFSAGNILAIFADTDLHDADGTALSAETAATCVVKGRVNLAALDATAQADADIEAALLENGIIPETGVQE